MDLEAYEPNRACSRWLSEAAQRRPGASALILGDGAFDYAALLSRSAQISQVLRAQRLGVGATVVVVSRSASLLAFLLHASLAAGLVLFPLDPRLPEGQRRRLLEQARADLFIVEDEDVLPDHAETAVVTVADLFVQAVPMGSSWASAPAPPGRPRLLLATSGSCGSPRLVRLSDRNLRASVEAVNERLKLTHRSVWLSCLPLVHIGGLSVLLRCVRAGASVVLQESFDAPSLVDDLHRHQVTHISLVPAMLAQLLDTAKEPPQSLQVALVGGAPLDSVLASKALAAGWPVWVTYGMTETASMLTTRKLRCGDDNPRQVGSPLRGFELRVVDAEGEPTTGQGVIQVRSASVHGGGTRRGVRWFSTGDRGQLDSAGRLTLLGRADSMLLSGGENVYPELVEQLLVSCPGIDEVAVTGRADPVWGERVVAVYRGDIDETALAKLCRSGIKGAMRPRAFMKVDSLPRTANGKPDRAALRTLVANRG